MERVGLGRRGRAPGRRRDRDQRRRQPPLVGVGVVDRASTRSGSGRTGPGPRAALAIGLGVLPLIGGHRLARAPPRRATREGRAFTIVGVAALVTFGWYTAIKGAYLSTVVLDRDRRAEPDLPRPDPLRRPGARARAPRHTLVVGARAAALRGSTRRRHVRTRSRPVPVLRGSRARDHGASRTAIFHWPQRNDRDARCVAVARLGSGARSSCRLSGAPRPAPRDRGRLRGVDARLERDDRDLRGAGRVPPSRSLARHCPRPFDWVDRATGGEPTVFLGQQFGDPNGIWLTEFWNSSIDRVWSVDRRAGATAGTLTPDLARPDGTLSAVPDAEYALAQRGRASQAPSATPGRRAARRRRARRQAASSSRPRRPGHRGRRVADGARRDVLRVLRLQRASTRQRQGRAHVVKPTGSLRRPRRPGAT